MSNEQIHKCKSQMTEEELKEKVEKEGYLSEKFAILFRLNQLRQYYISVSYLDEAKKRKIIECIDELYKLIVYEMTGNEEK